MRLLNKFSMLLGMFVLVGTDSFFSAKNSAFPIDDKQFNSDSLNLKSKLESDDCDSLLSYKEVLRNYYNEAVSRLQKNNGIMPYTFDEFCNNYYSSNLQLNEYVDCVVNDGMNYSENLDGAKPLKGSVLSAIYPTAPYILSDAFKANKNCVTTPYTAFRNGDPVYTLDYSNIQVGDIVCETLTVNENCGHSGYVYNINKPRTTSNGGKDTYIQTIDAVGDGVVFGVLDDQRIVDYGVVIVRPKETNNEIVKKASQFIYNQVGKKYSYNFFEYKTDEMEEDWYCSELIYAAYKSAGVKICEPSLRLLADVRFLAKEMGYNYTDGNYQINEFLKKLYEDGKIPYEMTADSEGFLKSCLPKDIMLSNYVSIIPVSRNALYPELLKCDIYGQNGLKLTDTFRIQGIGLGFAKIRLHNFSNKTINVRYSNHFVRAKYAKECTINDPSEVSISAGSYVDVDIWGMTCNDLGDHAVFSYFDDTCNTTYVTYCHQLVSDRVPSGLETDLETAGIKAGLGSGSLLGVGFALGNAINLVKPLINFMVMPMAIVSYQIRKNGCVYNPIKIDKKGISDSFDFASCYKWYKFTADSAGVYKFSSTHENVTGVSTCVCCEMFDDFVLGTSNDGAVAFDEGNTNWNFEISRYLTKGQTIYLRVHNFFEYAAGGKFTIKISQPLLGVNTISKDVVNYVDNFYLSAGSVILRQIKFDVAGYKIIQSMCKEATEMRMYDNSGNYMGGLNNLGCKNNDFITPYVDAGYYYIEIKLSSLDYDLEDAFEGRLMITATYSRYNSIDNLTRITCAKGYGYLYIFLAKVSQADVARIIPNQTGYYGFDTTMTDNGGTFFTRFKIYDAETGEEIPCAVDHTVSGKQAGSYYLDSSKMYYVIVSTDRPATRADNIHIQLGAFYDNDLNLVTTGKDSLSISAKSTYIERVFQVNAGQSCEFTFSFEIQGQKLFQTFCNDDAYLELYDANGNKIDYDDDDGDGYNALITRNLLPKVTYKLKIRFWSASKSGKIKVGINQLYNGLTSYTAFEKINTPSTVGVNYPLNLLATTKENCSNIWNIIPNTSGTYTIYSADYNKNHVDSFIYVVDTKNSEYTALCGGYGNNKVTMRLEKDHKYEIVYGSTGNYHNSYGEMYVKVAYGII